jgi:hypothetical protein
MRSWANQLREYYGNISITYPGGAPIGGAHNVAAVAGQSALTEYAGNANTIGSTSLAIGQTATGAATILARGAQSLTIGANAGGQISVASTGAITIESTTGTAIAIGANGAAQLNINASGAVSLLSTSTQTFQAGNNSGTLNIASTGAFNVVDPTGSTWGTPTGGAQGASTINVAGGYFVNGVANGYGSYVKTKASATSRTTTTTPANDPDLNVALPGAGTYVARIVWWGGAVAAAGLAYNINYSGTFTAATSGWYALNIDASSVTSSTFVGIANIQSTVTGATAGQITASAQQGPFIIEIILVATGAGTLGMAWCQISSSASAATVENQSYMTVTRIA